MPVIIARYIYGVGPGKTVEPLPCPRPGGNKAAAVAAAKPAEPTLLEMAENFAAAVDRWARSGFRTASPEVYAARSAICNACPHWDGAARRGLGKCKAPGCGCTGLKRWLETEKCPLGKW